MASYSPAASSVVFTRLLRPQVTGASEGGLVDGQSYDKVYPIEVEGLGGEVRKLQIGYNDGESPFMAGQRFIDKNELPQSYLGQIADYITKRAGATPPTLGCVLRFFSSFFFFAVSPVCFYRFFVALTVRESYNRVIRTKSHFFLP